MGVQRQALETRWAASRVRWRVWGLSVGDRDGERRAKGGTSSRTQQAALAVRTVQVQDRTVWIVRDCVLCTVHTGAGGRARGAYYKLVGDVEAADGRRGWRDGCRTRCGLQACGERNGARTRFDCAGVKPSACGHGRQHMGTMGTHDPPDDMTSDWTQFTHSIATVGSKFRRRPWLQPAGPHPLPTDTQYWYCTRPLVAGGCTVFCMYSRRAPASPVASGRRPKLPCASSVSYFASLPFFPWTGKESIRHAEHEPMSPLADQQLPTSPPADRASSPSPGTGAAGLCESVRA